uniref:GRF-type domain-containing protein n=2 Tax=Chenopodium quinoa TaxID=63459 RepID=A0A803NEW5_CHEQI
MATNDVVFVTSQNHTVDGGTPHWEGQISKSCKANSAVLQIMASGRSFQGGSCGSYVNSRGGGGCYLTTKCSCGLDAVVRNVKKGHNIGSKFYGCPKWPDTNCNFMKWIEASNEDELRFQIFEKDTTIAELEFQKTLLEEKVKKLQGRKEKLEEEVKELTREVGQLRIEVMHCSRAESNFCNLRLLDSLTYSYHLYYWSYG